MITSTFRCDRCKREWPLKDNGDPDGAQIVALEILVGFGQRVTSGYGAITRSAQWCRQCVMQVGIEIPRCEDDKKVAPIKELTFEEKFLSLLQEIGIQPTQ